MADVDIPNFELLAGSLIPRPRQSRPHTLVRQQLFEYMVEACSLVRVEQRTPIDVHPDDVSTNELIPALIVVNTPPISIRDRNPGPTNLLLVCEISEAKPCL